MLSFRSVFTPVKLLMRYQSIVWTLTRYGIAGSLTSLGMEFGKRGIRWISPQAMSVNEFDEVFGRNLAITFEKLGPTFIKLGQVLASRPDFVGEKVAQELQVLFSKVRPIKLARVKSILESELGRNKVKERIAEIDKNPLGSASIGQTHRGKLKDGTPVVIKVQKPGVAETVRLDLLLLEGIVTPASLAFPKLGLQEMFRDFREATFREIDYREEAKNIRRFQKNYKKIFSGADVLFPNYFPELSTERVLVLEPMRGKPISQIKSGTRTAKHAAQKGVEAVFEQIFDHGFFHADPHGANLFFVEEEGRMGFIDLGLVGQLEPDDKKRFLKVLMAILKRDRTQLAKSLFDMGTPGVGTDFNQFDRAIQKLLDEVKTAGLEQLKLEKLVNQLLSTARDNQIYIPNRYVMMIRSCLIIEGVAKKLDPSVSIVSVALPVVARSLLKSYNPFRKLV
ncbi:MAG: AarF/ABC1/UbiB kinase family protein [Proteobacteria bacterium]|nr:AarF/ABC1/UbiB kinase family protein [Pseudomonadota bacterium]